MNTDRKLKLKLEAQEKELKSLRGRMSGLSDQFLTLEHEIKGFKGDASRDIKALFERLDVLKEHVLKG